jgi:hypothetical protein
MEIEGRGDGDRDSDRDGDRGRDRGRPGLSDLNNLKSSF